jgi:hypothetical protein
VQLLTRRGRRAHRALTFALSFFSLLALSYSDIFRISLTVERTPSAMLRSIRGEWLKEGNW